MSAGNPMEGLQVRDECRAPRRRSALRFVVRAMLAVVAVLAVTEIGLRICNCVPVVGPALTCSDPCYGKRLKPSLQCERRTPWFHMHFSTNAHGWRGPDIAGRLNPVVVVGDDTSVGYGVDDGREYPRLLEAGLNRKDLHVDVVNLAIPDSAVGRALLVVRDALRDLSPRLVVVQVDGDDFEADQREGLFVLDADGKPQRRALRPPSWVRRVQGSLESVPLLCDSHLFCLVRTALASSESDPVDSTPQIPGGESPNAPGGGLTLALLNELLRDCEAARCPVVLLSTGSTAWLDAEALADLGKRHGVPLVLGPSPEMAPEAYFGDRRTLAPDGHTRIAAALLPVLLAVPGVAR